MIKQLLSIGLISASLMAEAQSFSAKYNFYDLATTSGTIDPTPAPTASGLTFSAFTAVGTSTASTAGKRFSFTGWGTGATSTVNTYSTMTGAIDLAKYYEVTLTPTGGANMSLSSITFDAQRSGTGIRSYAVRSSADAYAANLLATISPTNSDLSIEGTNEFFWSLDANTGKEIGSTVNLATLPAFTNILSPLTFRFYGWNSEAGTGSFSIDSVIFTGETSIATKLGTLSFDINSNFNVYPVPSHDGVLYIENKNAAEFTKIEVLDVLGNIVVTNNPKNETKVKLNLAEMPNGNYFVRMYSGSMISTKKIAIVK